MAKKVKKTLVNPKGEKLTIIIAICTYLIYSLIGYLFKIDILIPFKLRKNGGSINILMIILLIFTTLLIRYIVEVGVKTYKRKSS